MKNEKSCRYIGLSKISSEELPDHEELLELQVTSTPEPWRRTLRSLIEQEATIKLGSLTVFVILMLNLIGVAFIVGKSWRTTDPSELIYSPAQGEVEYRVETFQRSFAEDISPYQGWPDDEKDDLWYNLYKDGVAIHLTREEAGEFASVTERVAVEGLENEFLLGLAVSHDLHCLDVLRMSYFPERYPKYGIYTANGTINTMGWRHIDHCIDNLRQSIMCHSDLSVTRFKWLPKAYFMKPQLDSKHTCRNFERVNNWASQRSIDGRFKFNAHVENGKVKEFPKIFEDEI